jgi:two-component system cell cycle sensor histidine kinase/response regulator CckA
VAATAKQPVAARTRVGTGETILVVEDEPTVRTLVERILVGRGYTVLVTADPLEALRLIRQHEIDAVVTDVVMPGMKGPELVDELRRHRPELRALFTSGYTSDAVFGSEPGEAELAFVQKPFTAEQLAAQLRQLLDS